jgi:hypothetical protein
MCSNAGCTALPASDLTPDAEPVRITHPFHPARGQVLEVVRRTHQWGEDFVLFRQAPGHLGWIPTSWTSLASAERAAAGAREAQFLVADLLELAALLDEVRR